MRRVLVLIAAAMTAYTTLAVAQQDDGPYKVLKTARVGGEGGWDYIYADAAGRRLYIPRGLYVLHRPRTQHPKWPPFQRA
jgi:hypothetical protein